MAIAEPSRPTPEQFLNLIRRQERGRLKVYLGSAAGVGKTYAMLREGHRLKQQGVDVVDRPRRDPRPGRDRRADRRPRGHPAPRSIEYRGVTLREMDLDAILARRPTVCLVDELAHTNAPGSRHAKRYQDVEELLRAGIHVITTVNIQHLESLYDEIERATGVKVKERLPDRVLAEADQIVNVDVSAEDLLERLKTGKVYPPERVNAALENFFTPGQPDPAARAHADRDRPPDRPPQPPGRGRPGPDRRRPTGSWSASPAAAPTPRPCCARRRGWPTGSTPRGTPSTSRPRPRT